jgi:hypothetical protein
VGGRVEVGGWRERLELALAPLIVPSHFCLLNFTTKQYYNYSHLTGPETEAQVSVSVTCLR